LRRIAIALVAIAVSIAVAGFVLFGYRRALPSVPPHARVPADLSRAAPLRACWIETAEALGSTASSLLVRHPSGDLVIDTGDSSHFDDEIEPYKFRDHVWLTLIPGALRPRHTIVEGLRAFGVDPAHVRVILTHAHIDHAGGMMDMPDVPVLVGPEEIPFINASRSVVRFEVMQAHARRLAPIVQPIAFVDAPYETFDRSADLFGDGSVVIVPLPGHTPGHVGVFVNVSREERLFLVGDSVHDSRGYRDRVDRSVIMARTDSDAPAARISAARVAQFAEIAHDVMVLPAHARDDWQRALGAPGRCIASPPRGR
jgi:glyoxylase-like metal-dependent hydrolase (beta-lactamase superfamily II)